MVFILPSEVLTMAHTGAEMDQSKRQQSPQKAPSKALANPKNGSTSGLYNLHQRSIRVQNWGFRFLDPPRALGCLR